MIHNVEDTSFASLTLFLLWVSNFKRIANFIKYKVQFYCPGILKIRMNDGGNNVNNCRCRDAKGHLKEIYTHFTCATDTTNIQVSPLTYLRLQCLRCLLLLSSPWHQSHMSHVWHVSVSPKSWIQCQCLIVSDVRSVSVVLVTILMSHSLRCPHCLRSLCACQQCPGVSWCVNTTEFTRTQTASFLRFNQIIKF